MSSDNRVEAMFADPALCAQGLSGAETASGRLQLRGDTIRDLLIRLAVALWFFAQAVNFVRDIASVIMLSDWADFDALIGARLVSRSCLFLFFTLIAWLTLVRARPLAQAPGLQPRISALVGAYLLYFLPLLPERDDLSMFWTLTSTGLLVVGNLASILILLRLGRSFSIMAEARRLVVDGPYAVIRHPLYLAEQVALLGAFIHYVSPAAAVLVAAQAAFQIQRIRNEEAVLLRTFPDYGAYMARTARLIPGVW